MRKVLAVVVAVFVVAGCSAKSVEVSSAPTSDPTSVVEENPDCQTGYEERREQLSTDVKAFQVRLNNASTAAADPANVRAMLVADFDKVRSKVTESLDTLALECGATGDCAEQIQAWVDYEKSWLRELALVLSTSTKGTVPQGEPPVTCA
jgi:hypothetical protein